MKLIHLIFIFVLAHTHCLNAYAGIWLAPEKPGSRTFFTDKADCEADAGPEFECFNGVGKDLEIYSVKDVEVDDLEKPTFAKKENVQVCADEESCFAQIQPTCETVERDVTRTDENGNDVTTVEEVEVCQAYCDGFEEYYPIVAEDYSETYCTKRTGYQKKLVKRLVEDTEKKAAKEAKEAAKEQERQERQARKEVREAKILECANLELTGKKVGVAPKNEEIAVVLNQLIECLDPVLQEEVDESR